MELQVVVHGKSFNDVITINIAASNNDKIQKTPERILKMMLQFLSV